MPKSIITIMLNGIKIKLSGNNPEFAPWMRARERRNETMRMREEKAKGQK